MNKLIEDLLKKSWLAIISTILMGATIILLSFAIADPITNIINSHFELNFYTKNTIFKFFILLLSIAAILLVNKGKLSGYGFNRPENIKYLNFSIKVAGISVASLIFGAIVFMGILNHLFPTGNSAGFPEQKSIIQMVLTIWVWSSLCEEVLVRGFVQGYIQHLKHLKIFRLSVPVVVSGLFFGAMHLTLFKAGMGLWFVLFITFNTSVIGLTAAYYREKTNSLIPAFWVHFIANAIGSLPLIIIMILS
jgi:membrane protease YdiL (CAAX protease family)